MSKPYWLESWVAPEHRIDPAKEYRTSDGRRVTELKLEPRAAYEIMFPLRGLVHPTSPPDRAYEQTWTIDGRAQARFSHPDDLVLVPEEPIAYVEPAREDFSFTYDQYGYMLQFRGRRLGGAGLANRCTMHWQHARKNRVEFRKCAEQEIQNILAGQGQARFTSLIEEALHEQAEVKAGATATD